MPNNDAEITKLRDFAAALGQMHALWKPHDGQLAPGKAIFYEGVRRVFLRWGRQTGKTQLMAYIAVRWALSHAGSQVFIIGPYLNQARNIYLFSNVIQSKCPTELSDDPLFAESRFRFKNGSFIKILGADNSEAIRGLTADLVLCDEIKDFPDSVWPVIYPTVLARRAPLILAGTPPGSIDGTYWDLVQEAESSPLWRLFKLTSYDNPYLAREDIDEERARYERRGEGDVFKREYLAEYAPDAQKNVFPFLEDSKHVRPYAELRDLVYRDLDHWEFHAALDPGTASVFAGALVAVNPYRGLVYVLDELHESQQAATSVGKVWPQVSSKMRQIYQPDRSDDPQWTVTVDEAATWARNEILDQFGVACMATNKTMNRKANGISLIKDLLLSGRLLLSDRCPALLHEMKTYALDSNGNFIKKNDHVIDSLRYALGAAHFTFVESAAPQKPTPVPVDERKSAYTPLQDLEEYFGQFDPYHSDTLI